MRLSLPPQPLAPLPGSQHSRFSHVLPSFPGVKSSLDTWLPIPLFILVLFVFFNSLNYKVWHCLKKSEHTKRRKGKIRKVESPETLLPLSHFGVHPFRLFPSPDVSAHSCLPRYLFFFFSSDQSLWRYICIWWLDILIIICLLHCAESSRRQGGSRLRLPRPAGCQRTVGLHWVFSEWRKEWVTSLKGLHNILSYPVTYFFPLNIPGTSFHVSS